jgi:hypothetical protein
MDGIEIAEPRQLGPARIFLKEIVEPRHVRGLAYPWQNRAITAVPESLQVVQRWDIDLSQPCR